MTWWWPRCRLRRPARKRIEPATRDGAQADSWPPAEPCRGCGWLAWGLSGDGLCWDCGDESRTNGLTSQRP